jgi:hypothetical protein
VNHLVVFQLVILFVDVFSLLLGVGYDVAEKRQCFIFTSQPEGIADGRHVCYKAWPNSLEWQYHDAKDVVHFILQRYDNNSESARVLHFCFKNIRSIQSGKHNTPRFCSEQTPPFTPTNQRVYSDQTSEKQLLE